MQSEKLSTKLSTVIFIYLKLFCKFL